MSAAVRLDRATTRVAVSVGGRADALLIGLFAFVVGVIGAGRPSFWLDEAATLSGATRSWTEMWQLLGHVDAVHGLYYAVMHLWFSVFPVTEFWSRLPSALFVGGTAAGVVVLCRLVTTRSIAVSAGLVFAILPRTTWAAIEARSYALSMFDAVWLTVLCVFAARRNSRRWWLLYAALLAVSIVANVFVVLVAAVHLILVVGDPRSRSAVRGWSCALAAAGVATLPFLWVIRAQSGQVAWIQPVGPDAIRQILGEQYFAPVNSYRGWARLTSGSVDVTPDLVAAALQSWALVAPFIVAAVVVTVVAIQRQRHSPSVDEPGTRLLLRAAVAWCVVPTVVIVGYSVVGSPMYQPHYLAFTAPGFALGIGIAVDKAGRTPRRCAALLLILALAALPNYVAQRGPYSKLGRDMSQTGELVATAAAAGDCLNMDDAASAVVIEPLKAARPDAYSRLRDYGVRSVVTDSDAIFEERRPITEWSERLNGCVTVWTISDRDPEVPDREVGDDLSAGPVLETRQAQRVPAAMGFRIVERWQFNLTQVVKSVRPAAGPS